MMRKTTIVYSLFLLALLYIISPWFFERKLLFNEILAATGFLIFACKKFRIGNSLLTRCVIILLAWGGLHAVTSLFRMDGFYYYLRNLVILYAVFSFFIGYFCYHYLDGFLQKIRQFLRTYIFAFLLIPLPLVFYERFGMATLFPATFRKLSRYALLILILINVLYGFSYKSATSIMLAGFYGLLLIAPGYRFFKQTMILLLVCSALLFIYIQPYLNIIALHYSPYSTKAIHEVMDAHWLLSLDGNSTWRLVLWEEVLVDHFPPNLIGLGFGTPVMKYYPVEDFSKLPSLPYVIGAHNSYIYLFGRLGLVYVFITAVMYARIFKEYFYHKSYYYATRDILLFWSFFAISVIAAVNPTLETPIYASAYWLLLGFLARAVYNREKIAASLPFSATPSSTITALRLPHF